MTVAVGLLAAVIWAWWIACHVSERFRSWSNRKGLPVYGAVLGLVSLIATLVWRVVSGL